MNMKHLKMSLANMQGKMRRTEMRNIMAGGSGSNCTNYACSSLPCCYSSDWCVNGYCTSR